MIGRNCLSCMALLALVLGGLCFASPVDARAPVPMLEISGLFVKVAPVDGAERLFVNVDGTLASAPLAEDSFFLDRDDKEISRGEFVKRYTQHRVRVQMLEDSGVVLSCKAE